MEYKAIELNCPSCGAPVSMDMKNCSYCQREIVITGFEKTGEMTLLDLNKRALGYRKALEQHPDNRDLNKSAAFCLLKLKNYDHALQCFEKAMVDNFDDSEIYFYAAVALLGGKEAFACPMAKIKKIEEYVNTAAMIENRPVYTYFLAYIKCDFYARKFLRTSPDFKQCYSNAVAMGLSEKDVAALYELLGVKRARGI